MFCVKLFQVVTFPSMLLVEIEVLKLNGRSRRQWREGIITDSHDSPWHLEPVTSDSSYMYVSIYYTYLYVYILYIWATVNLVGRGWTWLWTCTKRCKTIWPPKKTVTFKCITFMMEHPGQSWLQRSQAFSPGHQVQGFSSWHSLRFWRKFRSPKTITLTIT